MIPASDLVSINLSNNKRRDLLASTNPSISCCISERINGTRANSLRYLQFELKKERKRKRKEDREKKNKEKRREIK